jgi:hypothetical protein
MLVALVIGALAMSGTTAPAIHLSVRPSVAKVAERTRFVFTATSGASDRRRPVRGALVTFAGTRTRTDRRGRAVIVHRFAAAGRHRARACKTGLLCGQVTVRALPYVAR